ncbi:MAG: DNA polymerase III subunit delta' [Ruminococcaceae bacterium]|nr:DNA polymerase III subunit delta' [Oscillospiraceae bacterium]
MMFPLAGNEGVKSSLEIALKTSRIPHAIIIEGESGSGKSVLARYIIAARLCEERDEPCGVCKNCRMVLAGTHPDLINVTLADNKKNISVNQIRSMRNEVYIRPQMSNWKAFNIDYADTMNAEAQNSILKVLEEPPGNVLFILQVRSRAGLLPTILSRCVAYSLREPKLEQSVQYLCKEKNLTTEEAKELLNQNGLQIGKVLASLESKKKDITYQLAVDYIDTADNGSLYDMLLLTFILEKDRVKASAFFEHISYILLCIMKEKAKKGEEIKKIYSRYEQTQKAIEMLKSNINLSLLFSSFAAEFK